MGQRVGCGEGHVRGCATEEHGSVSRVEAAMIREEDGGWGCAWKRGVVISRGVAQRLEIYRLTMERRRS